MNLGSEEAKRESERRIDSKWIDMGGARGKLVRGPDDSLLKTYGNGGQNDRHPWY